MIQFHSLSKWEMILSYIIKKKTNIHKNFYGKQSIEKEVKNKWHWLKMFGKH